MEDLKKLVEKRCVRGRLSHAHGMNQIFWCVRIDETPLAVVPILPNGIVDEPWWPRAAISIAIQVIKKPGELSVFSIGRETLYSPFETFGYC
jgi:hypothetical protein